jgi:hypothetical protein
MGAPNPRLDPCATVDDEMGVSEGRAARNEALFREVNSEIEKLEERIGSSTTYALVCECANADCAAGVEVAREVYRDVRAHPLRFLVAPGHEQPGIERVVSRETGYVVVEKVGAAASVLDES